MLFEKQIIYYNNIVILNGKGEVYGRL
jgi:hypothetical protein